MLELLPDSARTDDGRLVIGGLTADALAERFGTPLSVYCERTLCARACEVRTAVPDAFVVYGSRAVPTSP